jgi:CDP-diacylglycerol--glycerol-3-phosphate 3-phosphatidyltransferase
VSLETKSRLVNGLTFARVPLIFAWLGFAIAQEFQGGFWLGAAACLAMLLSGLTDLFDGHLARKWGVVSDLGKLADPLMDKVFYIVAFPALVWQSARQGEGDAHTMALLCFTLLYMLRDTWVTFMRTVGTMYGADVAAMWLGKVRTALSFPGAGWIYLYLAFHRLAPDSWHGPWLATCYLFEAVLIALTLASLVTYTAAYSPYLKKALARKQNL